jgi:uncharacterized protein YecT (DUF1311 family)
MWFAAFLFALFLGRASGWAFDCSNITLPSTAVICRDPELMKLADERQQAFVEATARLNPQQQKQLLADETAWIHSYSAACGVPLNRPPPNPVSPNVKECFKWAAEARIVYLRAYVGGSPTAGTIPHDADHQALSTFSNRGVATPEDALVSDPTADSRRNAVLQRLSEIHKEQAKLRLLLSHTQNGQVGPDLNPINPKEITEINSRILHLGAEEKRLREDNPDIFPKPPAVNHVTKYYLDTWLILRKKWVEGIIGGVKEFQSDISDGPDVGSNFYQSVEIPAFLRHNFIDPTSIGLRSDKKYSNKELVELLEVYKNHLYNVIEEIDEIRHTIDNDPQFEDHASYWSRYVGTGIVKPLSKYMDAK